MRQEFVFCLACCGISTSGSFLAQNTHSISMSGSLLLATHSGVDGRSDLFLAAQSFSECRTPHRVHFSSDTLFLGPNVGHSCRAGTASVSEEESTGETEVQPSHWSFWDLCLGPQWRDRVSPLLGKGDPYSRRLRGAGEIEAVNPC